MKKQRYTSADTSINSTKLPRVYSVARDMMTGSVIDYGCGRFFDNYNLPGNFYGYDPFNRDLPELLTRHYDTAVCSNVLNVIAEEEIRRDVLETLRSLADTVVITVYEGNRSGVGKATKRDCYQLNRRLSDYIPEVVAVFGAGNISIRKGCLVCRSCREIELEEIKMDKRYVVEIELANGKSIKWINGGIGYTKQELDRVYRKIASDKRITNYKTVAV